MRYDVRLHFEHPFFTTFGIHLPNMALENNNYRLPTADAKSEKQKKQNKRVVQTKITHSFIDDKKVGGRGGSL